MAIACLGAFGSASSTTSGTTLVLTAGQAVPAYTHVIIALAWDNTGTSTPTISGSGGPTGTTWSTPVTGTSPDATSGAGVRFGFLRMRTGATAMASGATVTVTFSAAITSKVASGVLFSGVDIAGVTAMSASNSALAGTSSAVSGSVTANYLVVGGVGVENNSAGAGFTGDSDTTNGVWANDFTGTTASGSAATDVAFIAGWKVVTATGTQSYDATFSSSDYSTAIAALKPSITAAGQVDAVSAVSGSANTSLTASGTSAAVVSVSGSAVVTKAASGSVAAASLVSGSSSVSKVASGAVTATSAISGSAVRNVLAAGTVAITSVVTGAAVVPKLASGTVAVTSSVVGSASTSLAIAGTVGAVCAVSGSATVKPIAAGSVAVQSSVSGSARLTARAAGTVGIVATVTGDTTHFITHIATPSPILARITIVGYTARVLIPSPIIITVSVAGTVFKTYRYSNVSVENHTPALTVEAF